MRSCLLGVNPSDQTAHRVKNVGDLSKRRPKEKSDERKSSQQRIEDDHRAPEGLVEKNARLRFAVSTIWLEVGFHAGETSTISVERRHFCLHRLLKPHQQKQRLPNWSAFVDNWHWRMCCSKKRWASSRKNRRHAVIEQACQEKQPLSIRHLCKLGPRQSSLV